MRKQTTLVVLSLLALTATARAQEPAPTAVAAPAPDTRSRLSLGVSFLPMAIGKFKFSDSFTSTSTQDAFFAYGVGVSGNYELGSGLSLGLAPQAIFNVQAKPNDVAYAQAMKELDVLARVAFGHRVEDLSFFVELLPGYSLIIPADDSAISKGLVVAAGVGCALDMGDRYFLNVGGGYQIGFQSQSEGIHSNQLRTRYVRVELGGGIRF